MKRKIINLIGGLALGAAITGCEMPHQYVEEVDLNGDSKMERMLMAFSSDECMYHIQELAYPYAETRLLGSGHLDYANKFYPRGAMYFETPFIPQSIGFRDVNNDGYLDLIMHRELEKGLESYVIEQTGDGYWKKPRKIDARAYQNSDKALEMHSKAMHYAGIGNYQAAIHLTEWGLELINNEDAALSGTKMEMLTNLKDFYDTVDDSSKSEKVTSRINEIRMMKGRF